MMKQKSDSLNALPSEKTRRWQLWPDDNFEEKKKKKKMLSRLFLIAKKWNYVLYITAATPASAVSEAAAISPLILTRQMAPPSAITLWRTIKLSWKVTFREGGGGGMNERVGWELLSPPPPLSVSLGIAYILRFSGMK